MRKNNKKILTKIGVGLGSTALAVGGISSVLTSCAHTGSKYTYTWDNVYSIQKSFLKFYLDRLNKEGFSSNEIEQKMQQASNDIDTIIKNGQQSGLSHDESIQLTYADLWDYSKAKQVDPFDWKMFDDFVVKFKDQLHDTIYSSSLPKDQKDATWQKYNNSINDEIALIKSKATSSTEAITMFKDFSQNFARSELKDQRTRLVTYYLNNFFYQHTLTASNLYYDNMGFASLKKGDVLPYGWFQSPNANYADSNNDDYEDFEGNTEMLSSICIDAGCINRFYKLDKKIEDYTFQCLFSRYDDQLHRLYYHGKIIDNNDQSITAITPEEQFVTLNESPAKHHSLMVESLQQHSFNFESPKITMLDWLDILNTISPTSQQQATTQDGNPIFVDVNLDKSLHMFYVDNKCLADDSDADILALRNAFQINLNVYAYDENANTVTYSVEARSGDNGYTDEPPYELFPKRTITFNSGIDQAAINNLKKTYSTLASAQQANTQKIESNMQKLYILNVTIAVEQFAMSAACIVFAALYFTAAPVDGFTTVKNGVMSTIAAACCIVGAGLATDAAIRYKKQYKQIKYIRSQQDYPAFEEQFNKFKNSDDGRLINSSRFGTDIGIAIFKRAINSLQIITRYYSKIYYRANIESTMEAMQQSVDQSSWMQDTRDYFHDLADAFAPAPTRADLGKLFGSFIDDTISASTDTSIGVLQSFHRCIASAPISKDGNTFEKFMQVLDGNMWTWAENNPGSWFKAMNKSTIKSLFSGFYREVIGTNATQLEHGMLIEDVWGDVIQAIIKRCAARSLAVTRTSNYVCVEYIATYIYSHLTEAGIARMLDIQFMASNVWVKTVGALRMYLLKMSRGVTDIPGVSVRIVDDQRLCVDSGWTQEEKAAAEDDFLHNPETVQTIGCKRLTFIGDDVDKVKTAACSFFAKLQTPFWLGNGAALPTDDSGTALVDGKVAFSQSGGHADRIFQGRIIANRDSPETAALDMISSSTRGRTLTPDQFQERALQEITDKIGRHFRPVESNGQFKLEVAMTQRADGESIPTFGEIAVKTRSSVDETATVEHITAIACSSKLFETINDARSLATQMAERVTAAGDAGLEIADKALGGGRFLVNGVIMEGYRAWRAYMLANMASMENVSTIQKIMVNDVPFIEFVIGLVDLAINITAIVLQSVWG